MSWHNRFNDVFMDIQVASMQWEFPKIVRYDVLVEWNLYFYFFGWKWSRLTRHRRFFRQVTTGQCVYGMHGESLCVLLLSSLAVAYLVRNRKLELMCAVATCGSSFHPWFVFSPFVPF
jgi:hypothetical protein